MERYCVIGENGLRNFILFFYFNCRVFKIKILKFYECYLDKIKLIDIKLIGS